MKLVRISILLVFVTGVLAICPCQAYVLEDIVLTPIECNAIQDSIKTDEVYRIAYELIDAKLTRKQRKKANLKKMPLRKRCVIIDLCDTVSDDKRVSTGANLNFQFGFYEARSFGLSGEGYSIIILTLNGEPTFYGCGESEYPYELLGELAYNAYIQKILSGHQLANILSHLYLPKYNPYNRKFGLPMKVIHFSDSIEIHGYE